MHFFDTAEYGSLSATHVVTALYQESAALSNHRTSRVLESTAFLELVVSPEVGLLINSVIDC